MKSFRGCNCVQKSWPYYKKRRLTLLANISALPTDVVQPFEPWPHDKYKFVQYLSFPRYGNPSGLIGRKPNQIGFCVFHVKCGNKYFAWTPFFIGTPEFCTKFNDLCERRASYDMNHIILKLRIL